jgi:ABC-type polysaccharide/polyol phosphate transport system ATPase subunit
MTERIVVKNLKKDFKIGFKKRQLALQRIVSLFSGREPKKILKALDNISFSAGPGEILGILGPNGSGKSTLLRVIAGIYEEGSGEIVTEGKVIPLVNLYAGLKERLSMRENIFLVGSLFGMSKGELAKKFNSIVAFCELEEFVNTKIYQFSEGMKQRLVFSVAVHASPDILLLDEVFEVGDEEFRKKSRDKIFEMVKRGAAVVLVSHDLEIIEKVCTKVMIMDKGKVVKTGSPKTIVAEYTKIHL